MFLTISMLWQWQNKQHFFFGQILNPQATFLKWHSNIVTADFVLLFHCWFGMSYWQLKSIHGDWVMTTRISEQPGTDHLLKAGDDEEQPANVPLWYCKICQGILSTAKTMAVGWLWRILFFWRILFCNIFFSGCPKLSGHGQWNPSLCCRASIRAADQFTPLGGCTFSAQIRSAFHTFCIFCEQVTTKPKKLLQPITMHKSQNSWPPGG